MNRKWFFMPFGVAMAICVGSVIMLLLGLLGMPLMIWAGVVPGAGGMDVQIANAQGNQFYLYPATDATGFHLIEYKYNTTSNLSQYPMMCVDLGTINPATNLLVYKFVPLPVPLNLIHKTLAVKINIGSATATTGSSKIICHDVYIAQATVGNITIADYVGVGNKTVQAATYNATNLHIFWMDSLVSSQMVVSSLSVGLYLSTSNVTPPLSFEPGAPPSYPTMSAGPY